MIMYPEYPSLQKPSARESQDRSNDGRQIPQELADYVKAQVQNQNFTKEVLDIASSTAQYLKTKRAAIFKAFSKVTPPPIDSTATAYPVAVPKTSALIQSRIVPGQHGLIHVLTDKQMGWYTSTPAFRLLVDGTVDYGVFRTVPAPGVEICGMEFWQLSDYEKINIVEIMSNAEWGTPEYLQVQDDLLHSRKVVRCLFLQCIERPAPLKPSQQEASPSCDQSLSLLVLGKFDPEEIEAETDDIDRARRQLKPKPLEEQASTVAIPNELSTVLNFIELEDKDEGDGHESEDNSKEVGIWEYLTDDDVDSEKPRGKLHMIPQIWFTSMA